MRSMVRELLVGEDVVRELLVGEVVVKGQQAEGVPSEEQEVKGVVGVQVGRVGEVQNPVLSHGSL